jgi:hypothetical protein
MKQGKDRGSKKEVRGFWSDVVASPYFSIGVDCETANKYAEGLFEIYNKVYIDICIYIYMCISIFIYARVNLFSMNVWMYFYIHIYIYICMYAYMYMFIF